MTPEQQLANAKKMGYVSPTAQTPATGTTPQAGSNPTGYDPNYHPAASGNDMYVTPGGAHGYRPGGQAAWNETPQGQQAWNTAAESSVPWWMQNKAFDASTMPALPGTNYASQLAAAPDPEAEAAKIQSSYDTLNGLNLQDYKRNLEDTLGSSLARRGITDSSGAINGLAGIDNWAAVQGARDKAEGLMAARQWAQGLRNENNNLVGTKRDWANGDYNTSMQNLLTKTSLQQQAQDRAAQNWYAMNSLVQGANDALGSYMNPSSYASGVGSLANNYANLANMYGNAGQGISSLFGALGSLYANKSQPQNTTIKIGSDLNGFNGQGSWLKTPSLTNYFG
jgi:hypothetical protein